MIMNVFIKLQLTNMKTEETITLTISGKSMKLCELSEKLNFARQKSFIFNQTNKLTKNFLTSLSNKQMFISNTDLS